jgi:uncharacterized SAM-binding protein YcdF (DUF218 family)
MTAAAEQRAIPIVKSRSCCAVLRRATLVLLVLAVGAGVASWFARESLLRTIANLWIVSDQLSVADAVAVFGGGIDSRPFAAADYHRRGLVKKVLLANIGASRAERLGVVMSHVNANRQVLIRLGVPESDIETFGSNLSNTRDEALALREWVERRGIRSIIVPAEIFSARRVRWTLRRVLGDQIIIHVPALEPAEYRRDDWWRHVRGLIEFQNEVIKYLYYRLSY